MLRLPLNKAEELKRTVSLRPDFAPDEMISFTHSSREFDISKADLYDIVKCRLEELADELVKPQITASPRQRASTNLCSTSWTFPRG